MERGPKGFLISMEGGENVSMYLLAAEITAEVAVIVCRVDNSIVVAPPVVLIDQHRRRRFIAGLDCRVTNIVIV